MRPGILLTPIKFGIFLLFFQMHAQEMWRRPVSISLYTVATQFPGGHITPLHPGLEVGSEFRYNKSEKNMWLQTIKVGVYYHQLSQTGIQVYSELDYRRKIWHRVKGDVKLGAGYLHAIPDLQSFTLKDGVYENENSFGRSQLMVSTALGLRYMLSDRNDGLQLFLTMQCFLQMPFIKSYVPVLPNTAYHIGVSFPFFNK
jgi:hypothetical protein